MSVIIDNRNEQDKLMLISAGILKARFTTLLLTEEKQSHICEQLLRSILPQLLIGFKRACISISKINFQLILVGFQPNSSTEYNTKDTKEVLIGLQETLQDSMAAYAKTVTALTGTEGVVKNNFFNLLPFRNTKSCKDFFATTITKQTEVFPASHSVKDIMQFSPGKSVAHNGSNPQSKHSQTSQSGNQSATGKTRRFIFFFIRPDSEEEYYEQLKFAKFLSSADNFPTRSNFKNNYSTNEEAAGNIHLDAKPTLDGKYMKYYSHDRHYRPVIKDASVVYVTHNCNSEQLMLSDVILAVPRQKDEYPLPYSDVFLNSSNPLSSQVTSDNSSFVYTFEQQNHFIKDSIDDTKQRIGAPFLPFQDLVHTISSHDEENNSATPKVKLLENENTLPQHAYLAQEEKVHISTKPLPLDIHVLGPVKIIGGNFNFDHSPRLSELIIYLAMHPEGSSSPIWSTALWPDKRVPMQTIANRLSEARRALGQGSDNKFRLRKIADRYYIADAKVDWFLFQELAIPNASLERQQKALSLVKGQPFTGLTQGYWVNLEGFQAEIEEAIVSCAIRIGRWCLEYQEPEQALWAAIQALKATPFDERLYRLQMRSHDMMGNRLGVTEVLNTLAAVLEIKGDPLKSVHPKTANLYRILTGKVSS